VIEILVLFRLCKNIGLILAAKGRAKLPFQLLLVFLWFGAELAGVILGVIVEAIASGEDNPSLLLAYLFGFVGAGFSAFILFQIAKALPSLVIAAPPDEQYYRHWQDGHDPRDVNRPVSSNNEGIIEGQLPGPSQLDDRFRG
jgi:uncharacterized membrane protein YeaQ/YmgE (transglycosylase-associated protein family)